MIEIKPVWMKIRTWSLGSGHERKDILVEKILINHFTVSDKLLLSNLIVI